MADGTRFKAGHEACCKRRNTGDAQMQNFGVAELYSFLGSWIRNAGRFIDRGSHVKYKPTLTEQRAYASEMGWLV